MGSRDLLSSSNVPKFLKSQNEWWAYPVTPSLPATSTLCHQKQLPRPRHAPTRPHTHSRPPQCADRARHATPKRANAPRHQCTHAPSHQHANTPTCTNTQTCERAHSPTLTRCHVLMCHTPNRPPANMSAPQPCHAPMHPMSLCQYTLHPRAHVHALTPRRTVDIL